VPARNHSFLQVFRIDDSIWISTRATSAVELALEIKDLLRARGRQRSRYPASTVTISATSFLRATTNMDGYESRLMVVLRGLTCLTHFNELITAA